MIKIRKKIKKDVSGIAVVLLWLLSFNMIYSSNKGNHLSFGIGLGPFGFGFQLHIYDIWLP